ncbi:hypothetical protein PV326_004382 [Microctonus aethiopoides]|nr:hypothetical protein PV326_004382 [Microctonus aethiopoides]
MGIVTERLGNGLVSVKKSYGKDNGFNSKLTRSHANVAPISQRFEKRRRHEIDLELASEIKGLAVELGFC